jgi:hypothetical protein
MPKEGLTSIFQLRREARQQVENQSKQEEAFEAENKVVRDNFVSRTESLFSSNFEGFKVQLRTRKQVLKISPLNRKILMK